MLKKPLCQSPAPGPDLNHQRHGFFEVAARAFTRIAATGSRNAFKNFPADEEVLSEGLSQP